MSFIVYPAIDLRAEKLYVEGGRSCAYDGLQ